MSDFDPKQHLTNLRGKQYLEVKWRLVWFRESHPKGVIATDMVNIEPPIVKAIISDDDGNILATAHAGAPSTNGKAVWSGREVEKAETAAIGRALAHAGFGTQFTDEDEGSHLADAPVEGRSNPKNGNNGKTGGNGNEPVEAVETDEFSWKEHIKEAWIQFEPSVSLKKHDFNWFVDELKTRLEITLFDSLEDIEAGKKRIQNAINALGLAEAVVKLNRDYSGFKFEDWGNVRKAFFGHLLNKEIKSTKELNRMDITKLNKLAEDKDAIKKLYADFVKPAEAKVIDVDEYFDDGLAPTGTEG